MNRAERRSGGWAKFTPKGGYREFVNSTGKDGNAYGLLMMVLREPFADAPEAEGWDDERIFDGVAELVNAGLLDIYFRFDAEGIEVRTELKMPPARPPHSEVVH